MTKSTPHRVLKLRRSPTGEDVRAIQRVVGVQVDGEWGPISAAAAKDHARRKGVKASTLMRGLTVGAQNLILGYKLPTKVQAKRGRAYAAEQDARGPKIYRLSGCSWDWKWGWLGSYVETVGHYTGGARDTSDAHGIAMSRSHHAYHVSKGWGGLAYWIVILRSGNIILGSPSGRRSTHVANGNTGRLGVVMHGTDGDRPTAEQQATFRWLLANAHTSALPESHRAPVDLRNRPVKGHNDLNDTSCPGAFKPMYTSKGKTR